MNDVVKNLVLWIVIAVVLLSVFHSFGDRSSSAQTLIYSDFLTQVEQGQVREVTIEGQNITGKLISGTPFSTYSPETNHSALIGDLDRANVSILGKPPEPPSLLGHMFISWFPFIVLIGLWIFFMRQMQGGSGGRGAMSFGKSKARLLGEDQINIGFNDVAGVDEAKEEVAELVEFLRDPSKFQKLGGKIPRGVLMVGSPGTGKTLLAKAIAGEAKVPFFTISGSDFVEMFVGVGASRVRDMFDQAKKHAPCIIFIDEIDAVGRHRGAGLGGGHDEREQTLNQLLVEMDGFEGNEGVIVIAATNRPDVLDPALLRPGRFDRQVVVPLPDVPMAEFERAKDKIMMGAERRSMIMKEEEKKLTAYHEAGHAIVGRLVPEHDPVYKVSIIPRGRALGVTMFLPEDDRYSYSKQHLESQLSSLFGGRIAEQQIFGDEAVTTGASNDIERATSIARSMVTQWGLSDRMGPLSYSEEEGEVFLGKSYGKQKTVSDETAQAIDSEIRSIIDRNYQRAADILKQNEDKLHLMADALMKYETIDAKQIDSIMEGKEPGPPEDWSDDEPGPTPSTPSGDVSSEDDPKLDPAKLH